MVIMGIIERDLVSKIEFYDKKIDFIDQDPVKTIKYAKSAKRTLEEANIWKVDYQNHYDYLMTKYEAYIDK